MFCKNCGNEIDPNAAICVKCGFQKGAGNQFCSNCGQAVPAGAAVCMNCGYALQTAPVVDPSMQKSKLAAGLLGIFLGGLGIHNFYLGYNSKGIKQLLLWVFFLGFVSFIWGIVDAVRIFTGKIEFDANGVPLADNI